MYGQYDFPNNYYYVLFLYVYTEQLIVVVESLGPSGPNQKIYGCLKKISDTSDITS